MHSPSVDFLASRQHIPFPTSDSLHPPSRNSGRASRVSMDMHRLDHQVPRFRGDSMDQKPLNLNDYEFGQVRRTPSSSNTTPHRSRPHPLTTPRCHVRQSRRCRLMQILHLSSGSRVMPNTTHRCLVHGIHGVMKYGWHACTGLLQSVTHTPPHIISRHCAPVPAAVRSGLTSHQQSRRALPPHHPSPQHWPFHLRRPPSPSGLTGRLRPPQQGLSIRILLLPR